jgi:VWFA-related protein
VRLSGLLRFLPVAAVVAVGSLPIAEPAGPSRRAAGSQEPQAQIRASVDVVRLSVAVVHTGGGVVPPLGVEDFEVYDNGAPQQVRLLHRPDDTPLRVALAIDASPSLRPWWPIVQRAAISFMTKLGRRGCPYVLPFSDTIGPGLWGRYTANRWRDFLAEARHGAGTSLHDALIIALDQLATVDEMAIDANLPPEQAESGERSAAAGVASGDPADMTRADLLASMREIVAAIVRNNPFTHIGNCDLRYVTAEAADENAPALPEDESIKAILLLSDGADNASIATASDVINAARLNNVPVFPVVLGTAARDPGLAALLDEIARATGGLVTRDVSPTELGSAYDRVLGYLGSTYVLVYDPPAAPSPDAGEAERSWHEVRVELRRPLLRPIVRPGYYR